MSSNDPAWDMPQINWQQQGSFASGQLPTLTDPDSGTPVCVGPFAREWLPFVLGAMDQLRNPSSWIVASDAVMEDTLARVDRLREIFGQAGDCVTCPLIRLDDCVLQSSCDGGATWTDVSGWAANFASCVQSAVTFPPPPEIRLTDGGTLQESIDGGTSWTDVSGWTDNFCPTASACLIPIVPPNPGGKMPNQRACDIAEYIAKEVIQLVIEKAVQAYQDDLTMVQFGVSIFDTIAFAFPITAIAAEVFYALYIEVSGANIAAFQTAATDPVLVSDLTCAIYSAINAVGYIDSTNLSAMISAVCGMSYTSAAVVTALCNFFTNIGLQNLQAMQNVGALEFVDCSSCGAPALTWCKLWDFTTSPFSWNVQAGQPGAYTAGVGWTMTFASGQWAYVIEFHFPPMTLTGIDVSLVNAVATGGTAYYGQLGGSTVDTGPLNGAAGFATHHVAPTGAYDTFIVVVTHSGASGAGFSLNSIDFTGTGTCPFGVPNC